MGPTSVVYLRQPSFAYSEIPPDLPGNIIAGSYLTALISLTGINLLPSVPTLSYGSVQSAFRTLMSILPDQDVFLIESQFLDKDRAVSGQFILIPETGSLEPLLSVFGVE